MLIPRSEYPRPQFVRNEWLCLNGPWQFEVDAGDSGLERGLRDGDLAETITVPFCPESELSGIGRTDFMRAVWYRRVVTIPESWAGMDTLLHFQAVDYDATVWVNGREAGRHRGGFSPFTCDLTGLASPGDEAVIVVRARDETRDFKAVGKQSQLYGNHGCVYTRTTGIWQTVWMEPVPRTSLQRTRITPDVANGRFLIEQPLRNPRKGLRVRAVLSDRSGACARAESPTGLDFAPRLTLEVPEDRLRTWTVGDPHLYDLRVELLDGDTVTDAFESYCGLRSVAVDGMAVLLNGEPVFQRLVLDQGYYPDGIMTAPCDGALEEDIRLSMEAGFNGARLHQKVFEERFLWHADRMGYLVWGEFGDWGCRDGARNLDCQRMDASYITQWAEVILRDQAHPCIIGWCPLNETTQPITDTITGLDDVTRGMFLTTKALDTTRPVLDASGYSHRVPETDIYDSHNYEQDPAAFAEQVGGLKDGTPYVNGDANHPVSIPHAGQPYFVSEFGGIWWNPEAREGEDSWGYGERVQSLDAFYERFEGLCDALLDDPLMFGYCYTQLTDVYQEQNGIYTFDRRVKFDMERIRKAQQRRSAIESGENS